MTCLIADVFKMFRMVGVHPEDWNYQSILWRPHPGGQIYEYWITVVVCGMACAMFLAVRAMIRCALYADKDYPIAAHITRQSFYADYKAHGADTVAELKEIYRQMNARNDMAAEGGPDLT